MKIQLASKRILLQCRVQQDEGTQLSANFGCFRLCESRVTAAVGGVSQVCAGAVSCLLVQTGSI